MMVNEATPVKQNLAEAIIGTWKLLSWTYQDQNGIKYNFFGQAPVGIITYDAHGYMNAQLMKDGRSAFQSHALAGNTPDESKAAIDSYLAYFGRYRFDTELQAVIHTVEGSLIPNWVDREEIRYVRMEGRKLCLSTPPFEYNGQTLVFNIEWEKV